jgi:hypothetical protein
MRRTLAAQTWFGVVVCLLTFIGAIGSAAAQTGGNQNPAEKNGAAGPASAPAPPLSRDETLWREVLDADRALLGNEPYRADSRAAVDSRRFLLQKARLYLRLYPGGSHRDNSIRLELKALFEIGVLSSGGFDPLKAQVEEYLRTRPSDDAVEEAAFWKIQCEGIERENAATQPTSGPVTRGEPSTLAAYREYIDRYPRSRHVPRMSAELFFAAEETGDVEEQRRTAARLEQNFPQHLITKTLVAQLGRGDAIGKPFSIAFRAPDGTEIDTKTWVGSPVLIVVWGGFSEESRESLRAIEAFRATHPEFRVAGVNLDESAERMNATCRELGVGWPQYHDGLGWACEYARNLGVRRVPRIFVVDREGRLADVTGGADWREAAEGLK